jgi:hypothetical protein
MWIATKIDRLWKNHLGAKLRNKYKILIPIWVFHISDHEFKICTWEEISQKANFQLSWKICQQQRFKICDPNMDPFQICINILNFSLNLVPIQFFQKLINLCKDLCTNLHVTKIRQFSRCYGMCWRTLKTYSLLLIPPSSSRSQIQCSGTTFPRTSLFQLVRKVAQFLPLHSRNIFRVVTVCT